MLDFFKSVRAEWFKIVWPSRDSVVRATIMILVFSSAAALFFFVVDSVLNAIVGLVF
jgi:preprotein translocase subunit SecE